MISSNPASKTALKVFALSIPCWQTQSFAQTPPIIVEFSDRVATAYFQQDSRGQVFPVTVDGIPYRLCSGAEEDPCNFAAMHTAGYRQFGGGEPDGVCSTITVYINGRPYTYADPSDPDCP